MSAALLFRRSGATKDLPMSPTKRGTVLVVEDEPTVRALAGSILADSGYLTLSAANAREAIALLEAEHGSTYCSQISTFRMGRRRSTGWRPPEPPESFVLDYASSTRPAV